MTLDPRNARIGTLALHAGQVPDPTTGSRAMPSIRPRATSSKTPNTPRTCRLTRTRWIYTRLMNPTTDVFEQRMAALDGGVGHWALASGMKRDRRLAVHLVHAGGIFVSAAALYGGTITLFGQTFKRLGIDVSFVDATDPKEIAAAVRPNTRGCSSSRWPTRRTTCSTIERSRRCPCSRIAAGVRQHGAHSDAVSPVRPRDRHRRLQRDEVHRGHGTSIGGVIVDSGRFDWPSSRRGGRNPCAPTPRIMARCSTRPWGVVNHDLPHALAADLGEC